jgi:restriction system protein
LEYPPEPQAEDSKYQVVLRVLDKLTRGAEKKRKEAYRLYLQDHLAWEEESTKIEAENQARAERAAENDTNNKRWAKESFDQEHDAWRMAVAQVGMENEKLYSASVKAIEAWNEEAAKHAEKREEENATIDKRKAAYEALEPEAIRDYCESVLRSSEYPAGCPKEFQMDFIQESGILVLDYALPPPDQLPKVKEVKYVKARNDVAESFLSEGEVNRMYDSVLYQICLRTIHEVLGL